MTFDQVATNPDDSSIKFVCSVLNLAEDSNIESRTLFYAMLTCCGMFMGRYCHNYDDDKMKTNILNAIFTAAEDEVQFQADNSTKQ